jgi:hypothetical protein
MNDEMTPVEITFVHSWHTAVARWLDSPDSTGWIPSDYNLLLMIAQLDLMGLADAFDKQAPFDKQAALTRAYEVLKADNALRPPDARLN